MQPREHLGKPHGATTTSSTVGFVLVDSLCKPKFMNAEAVAILTYPNGNRSERAVEKYLGHKIKSLFSKQNGDSESSFVSRIESGRRSYHCWMFPVAPLSRNAGQSTTAILFERNSRSPDFQQVADGFSLSQREREVVQFLVQGLTTKEIAGRMGISPNTVKAFLRLVMVKTDVTTRSGIVGKFLQYSQI
jgi:DNA-binding CsgD family transcriptional regulator